MFLSNSIRTSSLLKVSRIQSSLFHNTRIIQSAIEESTFPSNISTDNNDNNNKNNAALYAFCNRLGLQKIDFNLLEQAVTLNSFNKTENNDALSVLGRHTTIYYTMEYIHAKYPQLPTSVFSDVTRAYTSLKATASLGQQLGVQHIMRWDRPQVIENQIKDGHQYAVANCINAIVGAIYQQNGSEAAKKFIHDFILSRQVDILKGFNDLPQVKRHLTLLLKRSKKQPAVSRLLSETGRNSSSPVFVVGIFSDDEKLGEGFGSSLKMAEHRACRDALIHHYAKEEKDFNLPSDADHLDHYTPPVLGDTEAII